MNTKFFLLLVIFLGISITTSSIVTTKKEEVSKEIVQRSKTSQATQEDHKEDIPVPDNTSNFPGSHERVHRPNSDDDGKHHHFHFNRIIGNQKRWLLVMMSKVALTVIHVCCFLYCYLHVFH